MNTPTTIHPLIRLLTERGLLPGWNDDDVLRTLAASTGVDELRQELVSRDYITEHAFAEVLAEHLSIPYIVPDVAFVQPEAMEALPPAFMEEHNLLPLSMAEGWLTLAVEAFDDPYLIEMIERQAGCNVQVLAAPGDTIRTVRAELLGEIAPNATAEPTIADTRLESLVSSLHENDLELVEEMSEEEDEDLHAIAEQSPVVRLVSHIIHEAAAAGASDIHIEPHDSTFRVRQRIDGDLCETLRPPTRILPAVVSRIKILAGMDISQRRLPQDGAMSVNVDGRAVDLRVSTMATKYGEKVVMRLVDRTSTVAGLDTLGFHPAMLANLRAASRQANGIVLVTGPTGSGKSTTLYALLSELLCEKENVSTVEDPVERRLLGTNQFQVNTQAGFTFAAALRSLLRQDPDVLMVGEVRDTETARLAMEAALTGHLVLSTLHTNDAITAVPRLINMGVEPYLVAASLRAVLAQRLVRRICDNCREPIEFTPGQQEILQRLRPEQPPIDRAYRGRGCARCNQTGTRGRVGVFELLMLNEELLSSVIHESGVDRLRQVVRDTEQTTLLSDGLAKVQQGLIDLDGLFEIVAPAGEYSGAPRPAA